MRTVWVLNSCPAPPSPLYWNVHLALSIVPWRTRPELNSLTPGAGALHVFRDSRQPYIKQRTSNDVTTPYHRSGGNCWWLSIGITQKYYGKVFFSFLKIRGRQLCLNGRKGCNSIVTYYGFTILDLLREREGDSEQRSLDAALLPLFIDFRSKYPSGHNSRAPVNRHLQTICHLICLKCVEN